MSAFPAPIVDDMLVTADGYGQLCAELETLRTLRRQEVTEQLRQVREDGDPDDPSLFDLLEEQAQLEWRIAVLEAQTAAARIVAPAAYGTAGIGSCVRVRHGDSGEVAEYELVGTIESDVGTVACQSARRSVAPSSVIGAGTPSPSRPRAGRRDWRF